MASEAKKFVFIKTAAKFNQIKDDHILSENGKYYKSFVLVGETHEIWNRGISFGVSPEQVTNLSKYTSTLDVSISSVNGLGGIKAGTTVEDLTVGENAKSVNQIIDMLLFPELNPTITAPSVSLTFKANTYTNGSRYEVGTLLPTTDDVTATLNKGAISISGTKKQDRSGDQVGDTVFEGFGDGSSAMDELKTYTFKAKMNYAAGPDPLTSYGNTATKDANGSAIAALPASTTAIEKSLSVSTGYNVFFGVDALGKSNFTYADVTGWATFKKVLTGAVASGATLNINSGNTVDFKYDKEDTGYLYAAWPVSYKASAEAEPVAISGFNFKFYIEATGAEGTFPSKNVGTFEYTLNNGATVTYNVASIGAATLTSPMKIKGLKA